MTETPPPASATTSVSSGQGQAAPHGINVEHLADKVYQLLLADARLGRARTDSPLQSRRNGEI
jgi:hypothetical protein